MLHCPEQWVLVKNYQFSKRHIGGFTVVAGTAETLEELCLLITLMWFRTTDLRLLCKHHLEIGMCPVSEHTWRDVFRMFNLTLSCNYDNEHSCEGNLVVIVLWCMFILLLLINEVKPMMLSFTAHITESFVCFFVRCVKKGNKFRLCDIFVLEIRKKAVFINLSPTYVKKMR